MTEDPGSNSSPSSSPSPSVKERRIHRRISVSLPARVEVERVTHEGLCVNLSGGGLGLRIDGWLPVGTIVNVTVDLPDEEELCIVGEVVRYDDLATGDFAVRFMKLDQRALVAIHAQVADATPPSSGAAGPPSSLH